MPIFKILGAVSKSIFSNTNTIVKTAASHDWGIPKWKYKYIASKEYPYLHSSEYLKELMSPAIKAKDKESLSYILNHILKNRAQDIPSYRAVMKAIQKALENMDFIYFL